MAAPGWGGQDCRTAGRRRRRWSGVAVWMSEVDLRGDEVWYGSRPLRGAPCRACCSLLPTRSIFGRSFGDAGCPVTEGRMLARLGCAAYGDSPSDRYKKSLTANVRRHEGSKMILRHEVAHHLAAPSRAPKRGTPGGYRGVIPVRRHADRRPWGMAKGRSLQ